MCCQLTLHFLLGMPPRRWRLPLCVGIHVWSASRPPCERRCSHADIRSYPSAAAARAPPATTQRGTEPGDELPPSHKSYLRAAVRSAYRGRAKMSGLETKVPTRAAIGGPIVLRCEIYSITSSARTSSPGGNSIPSTFAVFRLRVSSIFVSCSTGMSAGFSPLRMRPV
jgi:hypothetical protein